MRNMVIWLFPPAPSISTWLMDGIMPKHYWGNGYLDRIGAPPYVSKRGLFTVPFDL